jgi:hypothetical protein
MSVLPINHWGSLTLEALFGPLAALVAGDLAKLNLNATQLLQLLQAIQTKITAVAGLVAATNSFIAALQASGFYIIVLDPALGGWSNRFNIPGAPPNSGYSAGVGIIAQAVNPSIVVNSYTALIKVLTSPLPIPGIPSL